MGYQRARVKGTGIALLGRTGWAANCLAASVLRPKQVLGVFGSCSVHYVDAGRAQSSSHMGPEPAAAGKQLGELSLRVAP